MALKPIGVERSTLQRSANTRHPQTSRTGRGGSVRYRGVMFPVRVVEWDCIGYGSVRDQYGPRPNKAMETDAKRTRGPVAT
jgi:hypothetical protein